jgi:hypothetical protein
LEPFAEALEACKMDDERLEHLVAAVRTSKHPRALGLLARAAWRFFEFFEATKASIQKQKKRGPTLDDLFKVHSHLLSALVWRIRTGDEESEKLVDKVCSILENMTVLGVAYSAAFEQVGNFEDARTSTDFTDWYLRALEWGIRSDMPQVVVSRRRIHGANLGIRNRDRQWPDTLDTLKAALDRRRGG